MKRISFSQDQAARVLEWYYALEQGLKGSCCYNCEELKKHLESFVDDSHLLKKMVDDHPYFP